MLKVLTKGCEPTKGSKYSAAVDLYASEDIVIGAGETKIIGLGVAIDLDKLKETVPDYKKICKYYENAISKRQLTKIKATETKDYLINEKLNIFKKTHYLELHPRSSLAAKGLIFNIGIIDLDYKDEIKAIIHNPLKDVTHEEIHLESGESYKYTYSLPYEVKKGNRIAQILLKEHKSYLFDIKTDKERIGGFGSTGKCDATR